MEEKDIEIDLRDILGIIMARIWLILLITLLCTVAGFCLAKFVLPPQYTSSVKIYVKNLGTTDGNNISYQDQMASKSLASTYIVILDDVSVYEEISDRLLNDYAEEDLARFFTIRVDEDNKKYIPTDEISRLVNISSVNDTEVIQVSCTCEVPKFSAEICTYISDIAPDLIKRVMQAGSVETVSDARVPMNPSGPSVRNYTVLGFAVGFVISAALVFILYFTDNAVTTGEDIKNKFNVPVLAEIPDIFMDEKGGTRYGSN